MVLSIQEVVENKNDIQVQAYCSSTPRPWTTEVSGKCYLCELYLTEQAGTFLSSHPVLVSLGHPIPSAQCWSAMGGSIVEKA